MSLINQVLRDLDQRHANAAVVPAAVRPAGGDRPGGSGRWRMAVIATAAVMAVAGTASAITWSLAQRPSQAVVTAAAPPVPAPTPTVAKSTPVVIASPAAASSTAATQSPSAPAASAPSTPAVVAAALPPVSRATESLAPRAIAEEAPVSQAEPRPVQAPASVAEPKPAATAEAHIEKKPPARTAHERAEAQYQRGIAAHQQGQFADASSSYAAALREEANFHPARQALGGLLIAQGQAAEAQSLLNEGLVRAPGHAGMSMMLARLHAERGEWQRAIDIAEAAAIASPTAEDLAFKAAVLQRLQRHAQAAEHFAAALRIAPHNGVWWMGLGMSLAAEGHGNTAKEAFNRARASGNLSPELVQYVEQQLRLL